MYGPEAILDWIEREVKPMRRSRQKTLAAIVAAAMRMRGLGVLALGRAVESQTTAKHIRNLCHALRAEDVLNRLHVAPVVNVTVNATMVSGLMPPLWRVR